MRAAFAVLAAILLVTTPVTGAVSFDERGSSGNAISSLNTDSTQLQLQSSDGTNAQILNFNQKSGDFKSGDRVTAEVEVRNTGDSTHTFFIGYSVKGPDGNWYDNSKQTGKSVTLDPNEREWISLSWTVEEDAPTGEYDAASSVWAETDRDNLQTRLDSETQENAFEVVKPTEIDAQISDFNVESGEYREGESVDAMATVENTGNTKHTFFVGYSAIGPNGEYYDNSERTGRTVTLDSGEQKSVSLEWTVEDGAPAGDYDARTSVWEERDRDNIQTRLDDSRQDNTFEVVEPTQIDAQIVDFDVESSEFTRGETIDATAVIENTGNTKHTFFIGYSAIGPNGEYYDNSERTGRTVTLDSGEQKSVSLEWTVEDGAPAGDYDARTSVWEESDRDNIQTRLDDSRQDNTFEVVEPAQIDAQIVDFDVESSEFTRGETIDATAVIENTGNTKHTFFVGYSAIGPDGSYYDNSGESGQVVTLASGEQRSVTLDWRIESDAQSGDYDVRTSVWEESDRDNIQTRLDDSRRDNAFEVVEPAQIDAQIADFDVESGEFKQGETIDATAVIENTGNTRHTFFVGYSAIGPDSDSYNNDDVTGRTITLNPGEQSTVSLEWTVENGASAGEYDVRTSIWKESDRDNLQIRLDDLRRKDSFSVATPRPSVAVDVQRLPDGEYAIGDTVETTVSLRNTGDSETMYRVKYRLVDSEGRTAETSNSQEVTLRSAEEEWLTLSKTVPTDAVSGEVDVKVVVTAEHNGRQETVGRLTESGAFTIAAADVGVRTVGFASESVTAGERATGKISLVNPTKTDQRYGVSVVLLGPNGGEYPVPVEDNGTVAVEANGEGTTSLAWSVRDGLPTGTYDARVTVRPTDEPQTETEQLTQIEQSEVITVETVFENRASIKTVSVNNELVVPQEAVRATVEVANTGTERRTFTVTTGLRDPDGVVESARKMSQAITLLPGDTRTLHPQFGLSDDAPDGSYDIVVTVTEAGDEIVTNTSEDALNVFSRNYADITVESIYTDVHAQPGETVSASVGVSVGELDDAIAVGYALRGPNGDMITPADNQRRISPDEFGFQQIEFEIPINQEYVSGQYDIVVTAEPTNADNDTTAFAQITETNTFKVDATESGSITLSPTTDFSASVEIRRDGEPIDRDYLYNGEELTFENLAPGRYTVKFQTVEIGGGSTVTRTVKISDGEDRTVELSFDRAALRGTVEIDGRQLKYANIEISGQNASTGADGSFEFGPQISTGYHTLLVRYEGRIIHRQLVELEPGQTSVDVDIEYVDPVAGDEFDGEEYLLGAACGDLCYGEDGNGHANAEYMLGWFIGSFSPVADARDGLVAAGRGDAVGVGTSVIGLAPYYGDSLAFSSRLGKFVDDATPRQLYRFREIVRQSNIKGKEKLLNKLYKNSDTRNVLNNEFGVSSSVTKKIDSPRMMRTAAGDLRRGDFDDETIARFIESNYHKPNKVEEFAESSKYYSKAAGGSPGDIDKVNIEKNSDMLEAVWLNRIRQAENAKVAGKWDHDDLEPGTNYVTSNVFLERGDDTVGELDVVAFRVSEDGEVTVTKAWEAGVGKIESKRDPVEERDQLETALMNAEKSDVRRTHSYLDAAAFSRQSTEAKYGGYVGLTDKYDHNLASKATPEPSSPVYHFTEFNDMNRDLNLEIKGNVHDTVNSIRMSSAPVKGEVMGDA
ncbi:hypothetical protein [Natrinema hispanicum]|uniref:hypothetical protein n=1 Tax=Natrinema hispanicum TaxID=392421 RepID=UPI00102C3C98|nr:hypothetical protein [Natrinema hispanicum]